MPKLTYRKCVVTIADGDGTVINSAVKYIPQTDNQMLDANRAVVEAASGIISGLGLFDDDPADYGINEDEKV